MPEHWAVTLYWLIRRPPVYGMYHDSIYCTCHLLCCIHSDNLCLLSAIGTAVSVDWSSVLVKPSKSCSLH